MVVRIRLSAGPRVAQNQRKNKHIALGLAALITPLAVVACVLAFWRLTADFKATGQFPITDGLFSHWQVWLGIAGFLQLTGIFLNRYGNAEPVLHKPVEDSQHKLADSRL